ncbi:CD82 antigen [Pseudoliparis swirei]|uniref:CD82 antigen n=1 Tax=Pseudoliparis swirei TaxID=2059687 RepID=UPI0024BE8520|nr:CD82 antigen [Pseudoliparis swirei]
MKLGVKIQLVNFCFQVFNFIFLALGCSVCGFGLWILFDGGDLLTIDASDELQIVGAGLTLIGLVVLAVSVVGIVGAVRDIRVLLLVYMGFLLVLVLGQLFITLLLLMNRDQMEHSLDQTVKRIISDYGGPEGSTLMDRIQISEGCCGRTGPSDWLQNDFLQNRTDLDLLPCSCFRASRPAAGSPWCSGKNLTGGHGGGGSYEEGCKEKVTDWLQANLLTFVGMEVSLMLVQVVQFALAVSLYRALGRKDDQLSDPEDDQNYGDQDYGDQDYGDQDYGDQDYGDGDPAHTGYRRDYQDYK